MVSRLTLAAVGLLSATVVLAQTGSGTKCGEGNLCPTNLPCCSRKYDTRLLMGYLTDSGDW